MSPIPFDGEAPAVLIRPGGQVVPLVAGRPIPPSAAPPRPADRPSPADRRRRSRPAFDPLRGQAVDIRA